jgi:hypothetical protein
MTHFTVGIIVPQGVNDIQSYVVGQMDPYYEHSEAEPYVCYSVEQAKADLDRDIARFERIVERQDPDYDLEKCRQLLEQFRVTTPDDKYREYVAHHEHFNPEGEPISTYNPDSKWDWYVIGGRWDGWINDKETNSETVADNIASTADALRRNKIPHAIITPDGQWHEHGQMGWWGTLITENDGWESEAKALLARYPDCNVLILDAHI